MTEASIKISYTWMKTASIIRLTVIVRSINPSKKYPTQAKSENWSELNKYFLSDIIFNGIKFDE